MAYCERHRVSVTTDASGDFTGFTGVVTGRVVTVKVTNTDLDAGTDITVTGDISAVAVVTLTNTNSGTFAPRQATHDVAGAASLYAAAGEPVEDYIWVANERVKVVVASGGNVKTGTVDVFIA